MSLHSEPPQRLKEEENGLQELSARSFSKERLDKNQVAIEGAIKSLPPTSPTQTWQTPTAVTLATGLAAAMVWLALTSQPQQEQLTQMVKLENHNTQAPPATASPDAAPSPDAPLALSPSAQPQEPAGLHEIPKPSQEDGKFKHMQKAPLRTAPSRQESKPSQTNAPLGATLGKEIQLFKKAKRYFDSGDYTQADKTLNQLAQSFPNHPLGVELRLLQIRTQLALSRNDTALELMQDLLGNPPTKPQAQWYKLLGEIQQVRNRCGPAVIAYSKALKMGLGSRQEQEVRQAVGRCSRDQ